MSDEPQFPARIRLQGDPMNEDEARLITAQINAYAINLPKLVKEAKDAEAWRTLGFASWQEYVTEALVISRQYADLLVKHAAKAEELSDATGLPVDLFALPERATRPLEKSTMVDAATTALAELPADTSDEAKAEAVTAAVKAEGSKAVEAARARREREAVEAAEREAAAFARGQAQANEQTAEPEGSTPSPEAPPVPDTSTDERRPQAAPVDGTGGPAAPGATPGLDDATAAVSEPPADEQPGQVRSAPVAVTTPIGWDWHVVFAMSPEAAVKVCTEAVDLAALDDAADWLHRFFTARKEMAA